jgi:hypothetical protein
MDVPEGLQCLFFSTNVIKISQPRRAQYVEHVAFYRKEIFYTISAGNSGDLGVVVRIVLK